MIDVTLLERPGRSLCSRYITIEEAAFLLDVSVTRVKKMIKKEQLVPLKRTEETDPILIHSSQIDRFLFPAQHIIRIDQRVDAQQKLVEILKKKYADSDSERESVYGSQHRRIDDVEDQIGALRAEVACIRKIVEKLTSKKGFFKRWLKG